MTAGGGLRPGQFTARSSMGVGVPEGGSQSMGTRSLPPATHTHRHTAPQGLAQGALDLAPAGRVYPLLF